jgi:hypothetical protein
MAYSSYTDVLDICGLTLARIVAVYEGDKTTAQVQTMIGDFIAEADQQIKDLLGVPIIIHEEIHVIDDSISLTKVYLGNYDETWRGTQPINVQACVQTILRVCVNGARIKSTDDNYPWTWTSPNGYIDFANPLSDGDVVCISYSFDQYLVSVPANVKKASSCLAGQTLIEALIGLRQSVTAFEAQGDNAERIPDKESLFNTRNMLQAMGKNALDSIGYGFEFEGIHG